MTHDSLIIALKCNICRKEFRNKGNLQRHKAEVHDGKKSQNRKKTHECDICGVTYDRKSRVM